MRQRSNPIDINKLNRPPKIEILETDEINKMLHLNKRLYLSKDEICKKSQNAYQYFQKILQKKQFWFDNKEIPCAVSLNTLMSDNDKVYLILEQIEQELLPDIIYRSTNQYKNDLEYHLKQQINIEYHFFRLIDGVSEKLVPVNDKQRNGM